MALRFPFLSFVFWFYCLVVWFGGYFDLCILMICCLVLVASVLILCFGETFAFVCVCFDCWCFCCRLC